MIEKVAKRTFRFGRNACALFSKRAFYIALISAFVSDSGLYHAGFSSFEWNDSQEWFHTFLFVLLSKV